MNSKNLIPGAIIFHLFNKNRKYIVLSVNKDIRWRNVIAYSLLFNVIDEFFIKDFDVWKIIQK